MIICDRSGVHARRLQVRFLAHVLGRMQAAHDKTVCTGAVDPCTSHPLACYTATLLHALTLLPAERGKKVCWMQTR